MRLRVDRSRREEERGHHVGSWCQCVSTVTVYVLWFPKMAGSICKRVMVILGYLGVNVAVCCR